MNLLSSLNRLRNVSGGSWLGQKQWRDRTKSKCRKDKDHDLQYGTGPPAEFWRVPMRRPSLWSGQQQHLLQWPQALGAQEMQWAQVLDKRPWLQMYTVPKKCTPLGWQITKGGPSQTWQAWGGSFLLLPRRHALSGRWLWTFNHNTCENCLEEVQGSATSSLFTPPLFQNTWPCVQLLCAERNAPCQQDLAVDKAKPPASVAKWQGNDQTYLHCQAARHCHHQVQWATCAAWHWGSGPHSEGEKTDGMDMWNAPTVQPLTYRMESVGLGGPRWHGSSWQRGTAEWKLSAINPHDRHIWRSGVRSAMRAASQLSGRGPTDVDVVNQKSDYDDMMLRADNSDKNW